MRKSVAAAITVTMVITSGVSTAIADDWTAVRLRGGVFALENGAWTQLERGSVVSDDRVIKSAPGGRVTLVRDAETIELGPDTTAQISDRSGFTTVYNHEGTVGIDAEARNVQHFAVQTPFLAAVVKGTAFTVQTSAASSTVTVARGTVEVDDQQNGASVSVAAGEQVSSSEQAPISAASVMAAPANAPQPPAPAAQQPDVSPVVTPPNSSAGVGNTDRLGSNTGSGNGGGPDANGENHKGNDGKGGGGGNGKGNDGKGGGGGNDKGNNGSGGGGGNDKGNDDKGNDDKGNDGSDDAGGNEKGGDDRNGNDRRDNEKGNNDDNGDDNDDDD